MKKIHLASIISSLSALVTLAGSTTVPSELETKVFSDPSMTPCPAVIAASPYGDLYVGVDMQGSVGKKLNMGYIAKLIDTDLDGKADKRTVFAKMDNPRGILSIDSRLIVLHSTQKEGKVENQQLSLFIDADGDGVADGPPKPLVKNIGNSKFLQSRGADHSTNNIRLGIDGWIYISIGDFGFIDAEGSDGRKLSMHGGGVVRVRPDGSEMETFIHGTRNVYDVSIDPFMNVFTRENTNDGVGWWARFSHYIQSGEYGYPSLYTNFPEDMLPALGEYGNGSGTGALYFEEPSWPVKYNKVNMMADWGRSQVYIHRLEKDGASFTTTPESFIGSSQVTDIDVDGSGRMYVSSWDGAGYLGNPEVGYVSIVTPKGWTYKEFPNLEKLSDKVLVALLKTPSSTARVYAQQEILRRGNQTFLPHLEEIAADKTVSAEGRVASLYTLAQLGGADAQDTLIKLSSDLVLKEHCIRAMTDRLKLAKNVDVNLLKAALNDNDPRVQVAATIALGRVGDLTLVNELIAQAAPPLEELEGSVVNNFTKSQVVTPGQSVDIDVDTKNYNDLYLIVNSSGDDSGAHAAWINPTITMGPNAFKMNSMKGNGLKIDLTGNLPKMSQARMKWKPAEKVSGKVVFGKDFSGKPFTKKLKGIGSGSQSVIKFKLPKHSDRFTAKGIITNAKGAVTFTVSQVAEPGKAGKLHSSPNSVVILPHIAMQTLLRLNAEEACIEALMSNDETMQRGALATMKFIHSEQVVDALISAANSNTKLKPKIVDTLIRLHQKEVDYDGSSWWSTRPNPDGPYYYPVDWSGTDKISAFLTSVHAGLGAGGKKKFISKLKKNKALVPVLNPRKKIIVVKNPVGKTSIEDIIIYVTQHQGNAKDGAKLIGKVGCIACHGVKPGDLVKGPDLTKLGNMSNADIAESIIKPGATIAKSWVTLTMKDGASHMGTIVKKDAKEIVLHNIAGIPTTLKTTQVAKTGPGLNMMSLHLCDDLSLKEFADLVGYIKSMDKSVKKK